MKSYSPIEPPSFGPEEFLTKNCQEFLILAILFYGKKRSKNEGKKMGANVNLIKFEKTPP